MSIHDRTRKFLAGAAALALLPAVHGCGIVDSINTAIEEAQTALENAAARSAEDLDEEAPKDLASATVAFESAFGTINTGISSAFGGGGTGSFGGDTGTGGTDDEVTDGEEITFAPGSELNETVAHFRTQQFGESGCTGETATEEIACESGSYTVTFSCSSSESSASFTVELNADQCVNPEGYSGSTGGTDDGSDDTDDLGGDLPEIDSLSDTNVSVGDELSIFGENFGGSEQATRQIFLNSDTDGAALSVGQIDSDIQLWTDTQIDLTVPDGLESGEYDLTVQNENGSDITQLTVDNPGGLAGGLATLQSSGSTYTINGSMRIHIEAQGDLQSDEFDFGELTVDADWSEVQQDGDELLFERRYEGFRIETAGSSSDERLEMAINGSYYEGDADGSTDAEFQDLVMGIDAIGTTAGGAITLDGGIVVTVNGPDGNSCVETNVAFVTEEPITGFESGGCPTSGELAVTNRDTNTYARYTFQSGGQVEVSSGGSSTTVDCDDAFSTVENQCTVAENGSEDDGSEGDSTEEL